MVQICNALLVDVLPPATQDPALNYVYVKRLADATGILQVGDITHASLVARTIECVL